MKRGFTLVEVLVTIGIIVILIGILIPVVGRVQRASRVAQAQSQISSLTAAIQRYQQDHGAFPGPLSNDQLTRTPFVLDALATPATGYEYDMTPPQSYRITGSENLVLGLLGGLVLQGTAAAPEVAFDPTAVGKGPQNLNFANPKRFTAYIEPINLSWRDKDGNRTGDFADLAADALDSRIPEFVDTFTDPMPILYLRARKGAQGATGTSMDETDNPVITDVPTPSATVQRGHFDLSQIAAYVKPDANGNFIGVGKDVDTNAYTTKPVAGKIPHGLVTVETNSSLNEGQTGYVYPYDAFAYFKNPASPEDQPQPRQRDGYILVGAGPDRVYGTEDDITSFGAVTE